MRRSGWFLTYLLGLHLLVGGLALACLGERTPLIFGVELLLACSFFLGYRLYRSLILPQKLIGQGLTALEDQDFSVKLVETDNVDVDQLVRVYNGMIDQLRTERVAGRQREEFLDQLLQAAGIGVVTCDYDGNIRKLNPWAKTLDAQPGFRRAVLDPARSLRAGERRVFTSPANRRYHVECATFIDRGFERRFLLLHDVTADLLSAEKEAYGRVIRMMAHEVNNSNAAIGSVLHSLLEAAGEENTELAELSREYLPAVIGRTDNLTTFMRHFAEVVRLPAANRQRIDLGPLLRRTLELMQPTLREAGITFSLDLPERPLWIGADPALLEQVVINAILNSRDSLLEVDRSERDFRLSAHPSPVRLVIADRGAGISPEVGEQLFTPFFSSKPQGQGVGLTLSREVLEAHGATYQLGTEEDGWTRFRIEFPPEIF